MQHIIHVLVTGASYSPGSTVVKTLIDSSYNVIAAPRVPDSMFLIENIQWERIVWDENDT